MRAMVFCKIRLISGQIHKVNFQYQEINKSTRWGFCEMVVKGVI